MTSSGTRRGPPRCPSPGRDYVVLSRAVLHVGWVFGLLWVVALTLTVLAPCPRGVVADGLRCVEPSIGRPGFEQARAREAGRKSFLGPKRPRKLGRRRGEGEGREGAQMCPGRVSVAPPSRAPPRSAQSNGWVGG